MNLKNPTLQILSADLPLFFKLLWPALLQGLLTTVIFFTDRVLLGHYHSDGLSVMQACGPILWSIFSVCSAVGIGLLAVMGRYLGAGETQKAKAIFDQSMKFSFYLGLFVLVIGLSTMELMTQITSSGSAKMIALSPQYFIPIYLIAPIKIIGDLAFVGLQAHQDTKSQMWISGLCGLTNLLISWLLVYGIGFLPELGILGASIGSAVSFVMQGVLAMIVLRKKQAHNHEGFSLFKLNLTILTPVLQISKTALLEKLIYHGGYIAFASMIGGLGSTAMAAHQALLAVESLGFIASDAFAVVSGSMVAQKMGAKQIKSASVAGWTSAFLGAFFMSFWGLGFWLIPEKFMSVVTKDPQLITDGVKCLMIVAIAQPLMSVCGAFSGALRGAGDVKSPLIVTMICPIFVRLISCYYLAYQLNMGIVGIWAGACLDWVVRSMMLGYFFYQGKWQKIEIKD
jgi:putative MATE family efflux protein